MNHPIPVTRLVLYVRDLARVAAFYAGHFGYVPLPDRADGMTRLESPAGGCALTLHPASKGHRVGQSCIKLVFEVPDLEAFKATAAERGLAFGTIWKGEGYIFANARDPAKNPIQIFQRLT
ncbi:MAG: glyoxalase [Akkermansiaceae bacterium]|nr:glyoxalase [Akkermansiaceae bacterium]